MDKQNAIGIPMEKHAEEYFNFLDDLRESCQVNMFGARPYLMEEFGLDKNDAAQVLSDWMSNFGKPAKDSCNG